MKTLTFLAMLIVIPSATAASPQAPVAAPPAVTTITQGPGQAAPVPPHGALVHLKTGVCNQVASVTLKVGGQGLVVLADGTPAGGQYHFPTAIWTGRIYATNWLYLTPHTAGVHYTLTFGSSDCPAPGQPGLFIADATTIQVTVAKQST